MASRLIPTMRYKDPRAMVDWLCVTLGFEKHLLAEDNNGTLIHAQLKHGAGMIMLGKDRDDAFAKIQSTPAKLNGTTQSAYVVVDDADDAYQAVKKSGAEIVIDNTDEDYGGRGFTCRDPEGHVWNVGTYDPWSASP